MKHILYAIFILQAACHSGSQLKPTQIKPQASCTTSAISKKNLNKLENDGKAKISPNLLGGFTRYKNAAGTFACNSYFTFNDGLSGYLITTGHCFRKSSEAASNNLKFDLFLASPKKTGYLTLDLDSDYLSRFKTLIGKNELISRHLRTDISNLKASSFLLKMAYVQDDYFTECSPNKYCFSSQDVMIIPISRKPLLNPGAESTIKNVLLKSTINQDYLNDRLKIQKNLQKLGFLRLLKYLKRSVLNDTNAKNYLQEIVSLTGITFSTPYIELIGDEAKLQEVVISVKSSNEVLFAKYSHYLREGKDVAFISNLGTNVDFSDAKLRLVSLKMPKINKDVPSVSTANPQGTDEPVYALAGLLSDYSFDDNITLSPGELKSIKLSKSDSGAALYVPSVGPLAFYSSRGKDGNSGILNPKYETLREDDLVQVMEAPAPSSSASGVSNSEQQVNDINAPNSQPATRPISDTPSSNSPKSATDRISATPIEVSQIKSPPNGFSSDVNRGNTFQDSQEPNDRDIANDGGCT